MNRPRTRDRKCTLLSTVGLVTLILLSISAQATESHGTCTAATMHGTYLYGYTGYTVTGSTLTRFAVAGWSSSMGTEMNTVSGQRHVNADCSATEIDTDQNGNIFIMMFSRNLGHQEVSFDQTDPNVVSSGTRNSNAASFALLTKIGWLQERILYDVDGTKPNAIRGFRPTQARIRGIARCPDGYRRG